MSEMDKNIVSKRDESRREKHVEMLSQVQVEKIAEPVLIMHG